MSSPRSSPRLSALVVSYRSGAFALACARSLVHAWAEEGFDPEELEIVVVDNASPDGERRWLAELAALGARVVQSDRNLGYAGGIELALAHSAGADEDAIAVLNADVVVLPGALRALLAHLAADPRCGAVAPRAWLDEERALLLPPIPLPTARTELCDALAPALPPLARALAARRARERLAWWRADAPRESAMLSGACLFLRRGVARALGCVLDARYPLYYEDADLARRLAAAGYALALLPSAGVLHHWSRSAGAGADFEGDPRRRFEASRAAYRARWYGPLARGALRVAERLASRAAPAPMHGFFDLGALAEPPVLELAARRALVLEISTAPTFPLAAGALVAPCARWRFPAAAWAWLFEGRYWLRALDEERLTLAGAWTLRKTTGARVGALGLAAELADGGRNA